MVHVDRQRRPRGVQQLHQVAEADQPVVLHARQLDGLGGNRDALMPAGGGLRMMGRVMRE